MFSSHTTIVTHSGGTLHQQMCVIQNWSNVYMYTLKLEGQHTVTSIWSKYGSLLGYVAWVFKFHNGLLGLGLVLIWFAG